MFLWSQACKPTDFPFQKGEKLTYEIYYHWGMIWLGAGEVIFEVDEKNIQDNPCYHFKGTGYTYAGYDWFYKVRDTYESYVDKKDFKPLIFKRDVFEGGTAIKDDYRFDYQKNKLYTSSIKNGKSVADTLKIKECFFDVMNLVYFARTVDFSVMNIGERIDLKIVLDGQIHSVYVQYEGKEIVEVKNLGKKQALKFSSKLIAGSIFNEGDIMEVWVTDDSNKVPLIVKAGIRVGAIEAVFVTGKGLKYL
jgi:uncharacterized membrane protein